MTTDDQPAAERTPAEQYSAKCAEIEQEHAQALAQADADYSRVTAYAGLVRQELVNMAVRRRELSHAWAVTEYETAVARRAANPEQER